MDLLFVNQLSLQNQKQKKLKATSVSSWNMKMCFPKRGSKQIFCLKELC